jgi:two-component sensor histidine kinase
MLEWLAEKFTVANDPRTLAILEWCTDTRFGSVLQVSNLIIGLSYISIPIAIMVYLRRRPGIEYRWLFWCFIAFILGCGLTHIGHVLILHDPVLWYPVTLAVHSFTAGISIITALALWPMLPKFLKIPTPTEYETLVQQLHEHRRSLFRDKSRLMKELNHRVRNNLAIIAGALRLQANNIKDDERCRDAVLTALGRINAISRVHEKIYSESEDSESKGNLDTHVFLTSICFDLEIQFDAVIDVDIEPVPVSVDESVPLAMILNELVTNGVKYGKRNGEKAHVTVVFKSMSGKADWTLIGDWKLVVCDKGPGIDMEKISKRSLGMRMIKSLATQLGGELQVESTPEEGSTFRVIGKHYKDPVHEDRPV